MFGLSKKDKEKKQKKQEFKEKKQDYIQRMKDYRNEYTVVENIHFMDGIPGMDEQLFINLVEDTGNGALVILNLENEAILPFDKILDLRIVNRKELERMSKSNVGAGVATAVLVNPFVGLLVGSSRKEKERVKAVKELFTIVYLGQTGQEKSIIFDITNAGGKNKKKINSIIQNVRNLNPGPIEL